MGVHDLDLKHVKEGDDISAEKYNKLIDIAKRNLAGPAVQETSSGFTLRERPTEAKEIWIKNGSGFTATANGIAEVTGIGADGALIIGRPTGDNLDNVVLIGDNDIPSGEYGYAWDDHSTHQIDVAGAAADDRVGSTTDSFTGTVSGSGQFLIRAVSGGTAYGFFSEPAPFLGTKDYCYVKDSSPASAFGYPYVANMVSDDNPSENWVGLNKFESQASGEYRRCVWGGHRWSNYLVFQDSDPATPPGERWKLNVYAVLDDYDASTLTWNDWTGLTTSLVMSFGGTSALWRGQLSENAGANINGGGGAPPGYWGYQVFEAFQGFNLWKSPLGGATMDFDGAYGVAFEILPVTSVGLTPGNYRNRLDVYLQDVHNQIAGRDQFAQTYLIR